MDVESREKFEGMYLKYQGVLRRLAYEYEIPPDYIDDVVQDTVREAEYSGLCCEQGEMFCHSGGH